MAAQGWMLEKPGNFLWKFRKTEPKKLHFAVTYFPNASELDPGPTEEQQIFEDYCARDGWKRFCQWGSMQIFTSELEDPTPIETDALSQVETIHKAMKKNVLQPTLILLAAYAFSIFTRIQSFLQNPVDFFSDGPSLYSALTLLLILLSAIHSIWFYFSWYKRLVSKQRPTALFLLSAQGILTVSFCFC